MASSDRRLLLLHPADSVLVARQTIPRGSVLLIEGAPITLRAALPLGHKLARVAMNVEDAVLKYGAPIGYATAPIQPGEHVHLHNVRSGYTPSVALEGAVA